MTIPEDFKMAATGKKEFDLLPEDTYEVVIEKIELRKDVPLYQSDETEDKFNFTFTIVEEGKFKGRKQWKEVRTVMSAGGSVQPSWLYRIFCAVNQIRPNDEETSQIGIRTINEMEGKKLRIVVKQKPNQKGVLQNKITDVLPMKGGIPQEDLPF